jgi:hypothetical protein
LADRGFKSIDLFEFIDKLGWKYCIRCTNDVLVKIEGKEKIKYLRDITTLKNGVRKFNGVLLSAAKYKCNIAVCKAEESDDTWYIVTNMDSKKAVREYKKRFIIEEISLILTYIIFRISLYFIPMEITPTKCTSMNLFIVYAIYCP